MEPLPDLGSLPDSDLKGLIDELEVQERELSYQRRLLHGKIDILRAELVARLQTSGGRSVLDQVDVDRLTDTAVGSCIEGASTRNNRLTAMRPDRLRRRAGRAHKCR